MEGNGPLRGTVVVLSSTALALPTAPTRNGISLHQVAVPLLGTSASCPVVGNHGRFRSRRVRTAIVGFISRPLPGQSNAGRRSVSTRVGRRRVDTVMGV